MAKKSLPDVIFLWVANYLNRWGSLKGRNFVFVTQCNKHTFLHKLTMKSIIISKMNITATMELIEKMIMMMKMIMICH